MLAVGGVRLPLQVRGYGLRVRVKTELFLFGFAKFWGFYLLQQGSIKRFLYCIWTMVPYLWRGKTFLCYSRRKDEK